MLYITDLADLIATTHILNAFSLNYSINFNCLCSIIIKLIVQKSMYIHIVDITNSLIQVQIKRNEPLILYRHKL